MSVIRNKPRSLEESLVSDILDSVKEDILPLSPAMLENDHAAHGAVGNGGRHGAAGARGHIAMMQTEATQTKPAWLDEGLPVGVLDNEQSEQLWDTCCASHPEDPFTEWGKRKSEGSVRDNDAK